MVQALSMPLDADSEGEGFYYVWSKAEIVRILGPNLETYFCDFFNISRTGNWEGKNIPRMLANVNSFAESKEQMNAVAIDHAG